MVVANSTPATSRRTGAEPGAGSVSALLFDLGNVLIDIDFDRSFSHWSEASGVPAVELKARFRAGEDYERHERGEITVEQWFECLRRDLGLELDAAAMLAGWNALLLEEIVGIRAVIDALDPALPRYVFSNTNAAHHACFAPRHKALLDRFEKVFLSNALGARKPEPVAFEKVLAQIGCPAGEILFFDDNRANVEGARAVGLQAVQVSSVADVADALSKRGLLG